MGTVGMTSDDFVQAGAGTAVGHVRDHNEDSFVAAPEIGLWLVADGMGGHSAGEVASEIACETIADSVRAGKGLRESITAAEMAISEAVSRGEGSEGMGTTVVAARVNGARYEIAWVGDSRAYLWHDNRLRQLTHDHSFVQELLDQHAITAEEAEAHPDKSVLSRCLGGGTSGPVEVDRLENNFFANELLVLCSDGVAGEVPFESIEQKIRDLTNQSAAPQTICEGLIALALEHGGNDNATAIVIAAPPDAPQRIRQTAPRKAIATEPAPAGTRLVSKWPLLVLAAILLIVLVLIAVFVPNAQQASPASDTSLSQTLQIPSSPNLSSAHVMRAGHSIEGLHA